MENIALVHNMFVIAALAVYLAGSFRLKKYLKALAVK